MNALKTDITSSVMTKLISIVNINNGCPDKIAPAIIKSFDNPSINHFITAGILIEQFHTDEAIAEVYNNIFYNINDN